MLSGEPAFFSLVRRESGQSDTRIHNRKDSDLLFSVGTPLFYGGNRGIKWRRRESNPRPAL